VEKNCLFCKIASGIIPSDEVYSDEEFFAFRDINPEAPTHVLLIPRKHIAKISEAEDSDCELLGKLMLRAKAIAVAEGLDAPDKGFRLVMNCGEGAGQSVFHMHMHILGGRAMSWPPG